MPPLYMTHKDTPGAAPATTTQGAFDKVWSKKGWELVNEEQAAELFAEANEPPPNPDELTGQALHDALVAANLPTSGTADEKRAALAAYYAAQEG